MEILELRSEGNVVEFVGDSIFIFPKSGKLVVFKDDDNGMSDMNILKSVMEAQAELIKDSYDTSEDYLNSEDESDGILMMFVDDLEQESGRMVTDEIPRTLCVCMTGTSNISDDVTAYFNYLNVDTVISEECLRVWEKELLIFISVPERCKESTRDLVILFVNVISEELRCLENQECFVYDVKECD